MYPDNYSFRAFTRNPFTGEHGVGVYPASHCGRVPLTRPFELPKSDLAMAYENRAHFGETKGARFRRMFPNLPESSKISPELEARIIHDSQSSVPRCSRFQRTSSAGSTNNTTTTVGDTFDNHTRSTRSQRSSFADAETATFTSTAFRFQQRRPPMASDAENTTFSSTASRFQRRPSMASAAETTSFTTSTTAQRVCASRFQRTSFSSANGTATFTNTMSSGVCYPHPVPSTTLPLLRAQQPAHQATTKPARVIQCDPLPGGKFPTTYSGLDYDTSKETMARTADEDYVIWKWVTKLGKDWGEQGLNWLQRQELIWRKRCACYREMVRKHMIEEEEREAIIQKAKAEAERDFIIQRALAIALAAQPATEAERDLIVQNAVAAAITEGPASETSSADDSELDGHTTSLAGFIALTSRWTAALARGLGISSS
ncbi:hypothetical protein Q7P35_005990 [Cladosporium inversicolor]